MKRKIFTILILAALTIAPASSSFSQTRDSNTAGSDKTISFLLDENEKAKEIITLQAKRIAALETQVSAERESGESLQKSYSSAQSEIDSLRRSNDALTRAVALNEQTIALITSDRNKWKDNAKKQKKGKYKAYLIAAGAIALKLLLP